MTESFCKDKNKDTSFGCKYCRKEFCGEFIGNYGGQRKLTYACFFLPYWGKDIKQIPQCPRYNRDGSENKNSLKSVCHVAR